MMKPVNAAKEFISIDDEADALDTLAYSCNVHGAELAFRDDFGDTSAVYNGFICQNPFSSNAVRKLDDPDSATDHRHGWMLATMMDTYGLSIDKESPNDVVLMLVDKSSVVSRGGRFSFYTDRDSVHYLTVTGIAKYTDENGTVKTSYENAKMYIMDYTYNTEYEIVDENLAYAVARLMDTICRNFDDVYGAWLSEGC